MQHCPPPPQIHQVCTAQSDGDGGAVIIPAGHNRVRLFFGEDMSLTQYIWSAGRMRAFLRSPNPQVGPNGGVLAMLVEVNAPLTPLANGYSGVFEVDPCGAQLLVGFSNGMNVNGGTLYVNATTWAEGL